MFLPALSRLTCSSIQRFASKVPLKANKVILCKANYISHTKLVSSNHSQSGRCFSTNFSSKSSEHPMKKTKLLGLFILCGGIVAATGTYIYNADGKTIKTKPAAPASIIDLGLIYNNNGYSYSLPKPILEGFLSGKAFDNKELYTSEEAERLAKDINAIYGSILSKSPIKEPLAVMTAGAPGVGKTTVMRHDLEAQAKQGMEFAYICPDDVCLKQQKWTYQEDISKLEHASLDDFSKLKNARQEAYNKWRPGSNAANHIILANLIRDRYAFYFGTTSSSPSTAGFFQFLKKQGYKIRLLHVTAPNNVRWESIQVRDKYFVQTTEQDTWEKGLLVPQRINDTYLKFADEIKFYYRGGANESAQLAAVWSREGSNKPAKLVILDTKVYEKIMQIHNEACDKLARPDLHWNKTVSTSTIAQFNDWSRRIHGHE